MRSILVAALALTPLSRTQEVLAGVDLEGSTPKLIVLLNKYSLERTN